MIMGTVLGVIVWCAIISYLISTALQPDYMCKLADAAL